MKDFFCFNCCVCGCSIASSLSQIFACGWTVNRVDKRDFWHCKLCSDKLVIVDLVVKSPECFETYDDWESQLPDGECEEGVD